MHPIVVERTWDLLAILEELAPGRIEGLYLIGSVAYDDFHLHTSDVDFVAVSADDTGPPTIEVLEQVHRRLKEQGPKRPHIDGWYVTWSQLRTHPDDLPELLQAHEGGVHLARPSVIEWSTFAGDDPGNRAVPVRGPERPDAWSDPEAARAYSIRNLDEYWNRRWLRQQRALHPYAFLSLGNWGIEWGVLGVARLDLTIETGRVTSKSGGGEHALERFGDDERWRRIVEEALRIRRAEGGPSRYRSPWTRRKDALAFEAMIIERHRSRLPPSNP